MDEEQADTDQKDKDNLMEYLIIRVADAKIESEVKSLVDQFDSPTFPVVPDDELARWPILGRLRIGRWVKGAKDALITTAVNGTGMRVQFLKIREAEGLRGGAFDRLDEQDVFAILMRFASGSTEGVSAEAGIEYSNFVAKAGLDMAAGALEEWSQNLGKVCTQNSPRHRGLAFEGYRDNINAYREILLSIATEMREEHELRPASDDAARITNTEA